MVRYFATFTLILMLQTSMAQVTITSSDLLALIGSTHMSESDSSGNITINLGSTGANQIWDFTSIPTHLEQSTVFLNPSGTPFENDFPNANWVQLYDMSAGDTVQQFYNYSTISATLFNQIGDGTVLRIPGEVDTSFSNDDSEQIPLPLTYGAEWTTMTEDTTDFGGALSISERSSQSKIDAWGNVTVPAGTYASLRLREDIVEISSTWVGGFLLFSDTSSYIDYNWISKTGFVVCSIESQDGETNPNYNQAAYFNRLKSEVTAIASSSNSQPLNDFNLYQNYPNPFNPVTTISYFLKNADDVQISIYNNAGQFVSTLINEYQSAGNHSIQWNAQGLASGVYYYKLNSAGSSTIRKSILMK